ncbi:hypothetical protein ZIOFF_009731 [Zingiber officinale]|uniref:Plastid lipid-associated protein/fibrillin conserved domain-containing protein n=1 Tax=Zingiber officinale TaxID=94328 RepID=A0A8J5HI62_ZINOF|nr:hypothetical protein ZIOFF_009731 [Zingiber officinale]
MKNSVVSPARPFSILTPIPRSDLPSSLLLSTTRRGSPPPPRLRVAAAVASPPAADLERRKLDLLRAVQDTQRGLSATADQRSAVEEALVSVEEYDAGSPVVLSKLDGTWRLNYTTASDVLVLFEAATRLPFLQVGQIFQKFECKDRSDGGVVRNVVRWSISPLLEVNMSINCSTTFAQVIKLKNFICKTLCPALFLMTYQWANSGGICIAKRVTDIFEEPTLCDYLLNQFYADIAVYTEFSNSSTCKRSRQVKDF